MDNINTWELGLVFVATIFVSRFGKRSVNTADVLEALTIFETLAQ